MLFVDLSQYRIGSTSYRPDLLDGVDVHLVFHFSHLQELMDTYDNIVSIRNLVKHNDLSSKLHLLEKFLDVQTRYLRSTKT